MKHTLIFVFAFVVVVFSCKLDELEKIDPCALTPPKALFTPDKSSCTAPCTVTFANNSQNATEYLWQFGDSTSSSIANPSHVFDSPGNYTVILVARDGEGCTSSVSQVININATALLPVAGFSIDLGTDNGYAPAKVKFTNTSSNANSYLWTFGDGGTSIESNPLYEYKTPGEYTVELTVTNIHGSNKTSKTVSVKSIKFEQFYGSNGDEVATAVKQTSDGGYIVAAIQDPTAFDDQALMLKYDRYGKLEWPSLYAGPGNDDLYDIVESSIGGYYGVGSSWSNTPGNEDILIMRRNLDGTGGSQQFIGGAQEDRARAIIPVSGGFVLAGYTASKGNGKKDAYLLKIDLNGTVIWDEPYGGQQDDEAFSVIETNDGGYMLTGYSNVAGSGSQVYIVKTNSAGKKQWDLTHGGTYYDRGESIVEIAPGEFFVLGQSTNAQGSDAYVLRLTDNVGSGFIGEEKRYGKSQVDHINDATKAADGNIVLVGETIGDSSSGVPDDLYFLKIDTNGNIVPGGEKSWGLPSTFLWGYSIRSTSDGGFIIAGGGPHGTLSEDIYLVKTDKDGNH